MVSVAPGILALNIPFSITEAGSMVYKRDVNQGGWDGKFEGVDVPSGMYVYFLIDTLNDVVEKEGTISLVRFSGK